MDIVGWEQYGLMGLILFLVLTNGFSIIKTLIQEKNGCNPTRLASRIEDIQDKTNTLFDMHSRTDTDGVPRWFVREQLMCDAHKSAKNSEEIKNQLMRIVKDNNELSKSLNANMSSLNANLELLNKILLKK